MKTIRVLFNEKSGTASQLEVVRSALAGRAVEFIPLTHETDIPAIARGCDLLVVAGGDGTVHAVVEALGPRPPVPLAVIPLGTGNDFCRTLAVPLDPGAATRLIATGRRRRIDIVRVEGDYSGYVVNALTGGFSGQVAAEVTSEIKKAWGPLAYLRSAVGPVADPPTYHLTVRRDGRPPERVAALNVVVANARTAAGGVVVAPRADPEDGKLDVLIVKAGDFIDRAVVTARLMAGDYHTDETVIHHRARVVEIESDEPLPVSVDGELVEGHRFKFTVERRALTVVTGRGYRRNPRTIGQRLFGALATTLTIGRRIPHAAGLAATLFVLLAVTVLAGYAEPVNAAARDWLQPGKNDTLTVAAGWLTAIGGGGLWAVAVVLIAFARTSPAARRYLVAWLLLVPLESGLKFLIGHPRPVPLDTVLPANEFSFPSGHAMRTAALCTLLAILYQRFRLPARWPVTVFAVAIAATVCWTRMYLDVHWLTDVVGGALLGFAVAVVAAGPKSTGRHTDSSLDPARPTA